MDTRPPQKENKDNPLAGKANLSVQQQEEEDASIEMFSGAAKNLDLSKIESPAELLNAITDNDMGRSCMVRPAPLSEQEESDDDSIVSDDGTTVTTLSAVSSTHSIPKLYVVRSANKFKSSSEVHPGVYYGSWGLPDQLSESFMHAKQRGA